MKDRATEQELQCYRKAHPGTKMLEVLLPDVNGILRGKRIGEAEFSTLYGEGLKACASIPFVDSRGEIELELGVGTRDGDPDVLSYPVANTLVPVPWLESPVAQVLTSLLSFQGRPYYSDVRHVLQRTCDRLREAGLHPVVATEFEFYLLEGGRGGSPRPKLGTVPGTGLDQEGLQYSSMEDLWESDPVLTGIQENCDIQGVPATTALSEFSPGQFEINLHHGDDPVRACDQGAMLKRIIKGTSYSHGLGASFMAKPFADYSGCGLHIHASLYDEQGNNVFADREATQAPAISETLKHAVGGLQQSMADAMAIFAPNANSYRRLQPFSFVPLSPSWGYNHRAMALRIPVCDHDNMRIEHRVAGADANPYLVMAAILAGMHYGIVNRCRPGEMIAEGTMLEEQEVSLPMRWDAALDRFRASEIFPAYFGEEFCRIYEASRRCESNKFHAQVSNLDYEWYLRSV